MPLFCSFAFLIRSNRKLVELYTEDLNGATAEEIRRKMLEIYQAGWGPLYRMKLVETRSECVETFERKADSGCSIFENFFWVTNLNSYPLSKGAHSKPTISEALKILEELFEKLKTGGTETFAFKSERPEDVFFHKKIVLPREFHFLTEGSDRVQPDTKSMLTYDQFLPFNNKNHVDENCVPIDKLPWFYKNKGGH